VVGVVDCCVLQERFTGLVGKGAWLNQRPISVSDIAAASEGVLMTGLPARAATDPETMGKFGTLLTSFRKVRMIGSAAAALAAVAAGRAEYYRETGGMFWDVAGGCALVEAAGGVVKISGGALDHPLDVVASNAVLKL
jgi:myo-inositol-1(or 4)-monophosphatase